LDGSFLKIHEILAIAALIWADFWLLGFLAKVVYPAVSAGVFPARGRTHRRSTEPVRYWFFIIFFVFIFVMMAASTIGLISRRY